MTHSRQFHTEHIMREQMYHQMFLILRFRLYVLHVEHLELSRDEAAKEWVKRGYAAKFREGEE